MDAKQSRRRSLCRGRTCRRLGAPSFTPIQVEPLSLYRSRSGCSCRKGISSYHARHVQLCFSIDGDSVSVSSKVYLLGTPSPHTGRSLPRPSTSDVLQHHHLLHHHPSSPVALPPPSTPKHWSSYCQDRLPTTFQPKANRVTAPRLSCSPTLEAPDPPPIAPNDTPVRPLLPISTATETFIRFPRHHNNSSVASDWCDSKTTNPVQTTFTSYSVSSACLRCHRTISFHPPRVRLLLANLQSSSPPLQPWPDRHRTCERASYNDCLHSNHSYQFS